LYDYEYKLIFKLHELAMSDAENYPHEDVAEGAPAGGWKTFHRMLGYLA
jgi:hypothetical protein